MACIVLLEVKAKPGTADQLLNKFREILPDTRAYEGNQGLELHQSQDDPNVLVAVEKWDTKGHYEKYLGWRQETGVLEQLGAFFDGPPSIRYFDQTDA